MIAVHGMMLRREERGMRRAFRGAATPSAPGHQLSLFWDSCERGVCYRVEKRIHRRRARVWNRTSGAGHGARDGRLRGDRFRHLRLSRPSAVADVDGPGGFRRVPGAHARGRLLAGQSVRRSGGNLRRHREFHHPGLHRRLDDPRRREGPARRRSRRGGRIDGRRPRCGACAHRGHGRHAGDRHEHRRVRGGRVAARRER